VLQSKQQDSVTMTNNKQSECNIEVPIISITNVNSNSSNNNNNNNNNNNGNNGNNNNNNNNNDNDSNNNVSISTMEYNSISTVQQQQQQQQQQQSSTMHVPAMQHHTRRYAPSLLPSTRSIGSPRPSNPSQIVQFNVGGTIFATSRDTLVSMSKLYTLKTQPFNAATAATPNEDTMNSHTFSEHTYDSDMEDNEYMENENFFTRLLDDSNNELAAKDQNGAYFIDRNKDYFQIILEFIRTGDLVLPFHCIEQKSGPDGLTIALMQSFVQKLIREADFYMIDISSQLYNIVGDGIYISEEIKSERKSICFFDKDPIFQPCSVFINGTIQAKALQDKELFICNGSLLMYNTDKELEYVLYPTVASSVSNDGTSSHIHFRQVGTSSYRQGISNMSTSNVIVVRDCKKFNKTFILKETTPPEKILLSHNKAYFNLSDYNHSILFEAIDNQHFNVIESCKDEVTSSDGITSQTITTPATPKKLFPEEIIIGSRYTFSRMRPLHGLFPDEDEDEDVITVNLAPSPVHHNNSSRDLKAQESSNIIGKTRMRVIKNNFIAKSKLNFIYIESRNRLYWCRGGKLSIFGLSNKSL
jgi:hypothetical protein